MRILFAIPHYFSDHPTGGRRHGSSSTNPGTRLRSLKLCLTSIQQHFGRPQCVIDHGHRSTTPANHLTADKADVVVCTTGGRHLLDRLTLDDRYMTHLPTRAEARFLGFECHVALRERLGDYDYYCYLEDDLILHDPWLFLKQRWFAQKLGDDVLLMPNRYEVAANRIVHKAYVDGPMRPGATAPYQNIAEKPEITAQVLLKRVVFQRPTNPHSGSFFLSAEQMAEWASRSYFLDRDVSFVGPLESAATLGVMRTFRIYKPAPINANFLEIEHAGTAFVGLIKPRAE